MSNPLKHYVYEFGGFRLDAGHLMLYRGDEELSLPPKVVETLLALVERRGEIVRKEELVDAVWPDVAVEESSLFGYLSVLRKTLGEQSNGKPWVETLRRRGYRFNGEVRLVELDGSHRNGAAAVERLSLVSPVAGKTNERDARSNLNPLFRRMAFATVGLIAIATLAFTYWYLTSQGPIESIAVMPFVNEKGEVELDYLSDAVTETIIGKLSKVPELRVKSSASVARYKGNNVDSRTIGKELNAQALLYGHVAQRGDDVVLRVELVDAQTDNRLWDRTYNRKMSDFRVLEREVSRDLVARLKVKLLGSSEQPDVKKQPENGDAYKQFLMGRHFYRKLTRKEIEKGITCFDKAIELDPSFALAYAAKGEAYRALALATNTPAGDALPYARAASQKALEIDPDLAEAHAGLAAVTYLYDWNFADAENGFLRALELDPESSMANFTYGDFLGRKGEREKSFAHIKRARELEDLSPFLNAFEAFKYPDKDEALRRINEVIDFAPDFYFAHSFAGGIYRIKKMYPESIAAYRRAKQLSPDQTWSDVGLVGTLVDAGQAAEAREVLDAMLRRSDSDFVPPYHIAVVYRDLRDNEQALLWLEKAYEQRDPNMTMLKSEAGGWKALHDDRRFQDLLRRMGI